MSSMLTLWDINAILTEINREMCGFLVALTVTNVPPTSQETCQRQTGVGLHPSGII